MPHEREEPTHLTPGRRRVLPAALLAALADRTLTTLPNPPAGGGGRPQPNPAPGGDRRPPRLRLLGGRRATLDGRGRVTLRVRSDEDAHGQLALRRVKRGLGTLGHAPVRLRAGRAATVKVHLSGAARRALARHPLDARAVLRVRDAAGNAATASRRLRIAG